MARKHSEWSRRMYAEGLRGRLIVVIETASDNFPTYTDTIGSTEGLEVACRNRAIGRINPKFHVWVWRIVSADPLKLEKLEERKWSDA